MIEMNLYVGNLDFKVNEKDLTELFAEYGNVKSAQVITDKFSGRSRGFGFVVMEDDAEAQAAISGLNGMKVKDREIVVNEAMKRD